MGEAGRKTAAVAAVAVVAAAAGCGGGGGTLSKSEYQAKLKAEARELKADFSNANLSTSLGNLKELSSKVGELQKKLEHSASDIDKLKPPKDAVVDNHKLADTLHKFANLFGQIKTAAASGEAQKVQTLAQQIQAIGQEGTQASQDLKRKGYDIGGFGE